MVEAWFGILTKKSIRRGCFPSVAALMKHIRAYIARWNEHPTPFRLDQGSLRDHPEGTSPQHQQDFAGSH